MSECRQRVEDLMDLAARVGDVTLNVDDWKAIAGLIAERDGLEAERDALKAAKWAEKHVDTMNDMVLLGLDRDAERARAEAAEASRDALAAEVERLREGAERFHALMRCGLIKMQGSSGVDPNTGERNGNNVHFGAEFWPERHDKFPELIAGHDQSTKWGVACLRALADAILENEARTALQPEAGATSHD